MNRRLSARVTTPVASGPVTIGAEGWTAEETVSQARTDSEPAVRSAGEGMSTRSAGTSSGPAAPVPDVLDEVLVRRLRDGEVAAGDALVTRHHAALTRYLQRLAGVQAAEELHQQTWLSVLDHLDRFDPATAGGGFKAWLFRIATNKANDHWRSRGREKVAKDALKRVTGESQPEAAHRIEGAEQEEKLRRAIELLPELQRQVLVLRYYSNLKFVEIAEILGCPLNTALGRVHKALIKLRQLMAE